jgi:hypothetical protein
VAELSHIARSDPKSRADILKLFAGGKGQRHVALYNSR